MNDALRIAMQALEDFDENEGAASLRGGLLPSQLSEDFRMWTRSPDGFDVQNEMGMGMGMGIEMGMGSGWQNENVPWLLQEMPYIRSTSGPL